MKRLIRLGPKIFRMLNPTTKKVNNVPTSGVDIKLATDVVAVLIQRGCCNFHNYLHILEKKCI